MIQTIRLFRKKEDDLYALFIIEFLKFIGCIICDCELRYDRVLSLNFTDEYDTNLFIETTPKEIKNKSNSNDNKKEIIGPHIYYNFKSDCKKFKETMFTSSNKENLSEDFYTHSKILLEEIIEKIWENDNEKKIVLELCNIYCKHQLFFHLYNEGNRKFVQPQNYSFKERKKLEKALEYTADKSFDYFKKAYNELYQKNQDLNDKSPYCSYATIILMYKLNQKMENLNGGGVFKVESLLGKVENTIKQNPDFIRINYLAGSIYKNVEGYRRMAEHFFIKTLKLLEKKKAKSSLAFIYYRLGILEDILGNYKIAKMCYEYAYNCNKDYYNAMYKLTFYSNTNKKIEFCNEIIRILLNNYSMNKVMPKQQIYAYKSFKLLGDAFYKNQDYEIAESCYNNAIKLLDTVSEFFLLFDKDKEMENKYYEIVKKSMPIETVAIKLIECAIKQNNQEKREKYEKMR